MLLQAGAGLRWTLRSILFSLLLSVLVGSMARAAAPNVELLWPQGAPAENSVQFYLALRRAGLQAEMHIYRAGRHGLGLAGKVPGTSTWSDRLKEWMQTQGLLGSKKQSAGAFHAPYGFTARTVTPCSHRAARDPLRHWSEDEIAWP